MRDRSLTKAYIQRRENTDVSKISLNILIPSMVGLKKSPFLLIIQSTSKDCAKLTIYPVYRKKIIKLSLSGQKVSDQVIHILSKILKRYEIIHSSGFLMKHKQLFYECYLNLNLSDAKSKDLKTSLDKIKNIFKEIKIEEISLNNS
ncbi:MAG: hypothetical protein ACFFHV_06480 [Promethearchaeota archaeon]